MDGRAWVIAGCLLAACAESEFPSSFDEETGETDADGETGVAVDVDLPLTEPGCVAPQGVSAAPTSVEEAVELINALPKPVDVPCYVESLQRPLDLELTRSVFSAQPAFGSDNPRMFIFHGDLVTSIVPDGDGRHLLEFGQVIEPHRTIKAELALPIVEPVELADAFDRIRYQDGTGCGVCHRNEEPTDLVPGVEAFVSNEYRPTWDAVVELDDAIAEYEECATADYRCRVLHAVFDHGPVRHHPFDEDVPTIFDE